MFVCVHYQVSFVCCHPQHTCKEQSKTLSFDDIDCVWYNNWIRPILWVTYACALVWFGVRKTVNVIFIVYLQKYEGNTIQEDYSTFL